MQEQKKTRNKLVLSLQMFSRALKWFVRKREQLNKAMHTHYNPHRIALVSSLAVGIIWIFMLFIPPYLGVADDGTSYKVLDRGGISYGEEAAEDIYSNYYVRRYYMQEDMGGDKLPFNSQDIIIRGAIFLDQLLTRAQSFDLRFLALLYGVMYLPGIYLLAKNASRKVKNFTEASVIVVLTMLIFADVSYITYFSSFYPEALWLVCLVACTALICNIYIKKNTYKSMMALLVYGIIFTSSRQQCGVIGFVIAAFFIRAIFLNKKLLMKIGCIFCALTISTVAMFSIGTLESDFSLTSKFHTMTRGVLFQAPNPVKALAEFGIHNSYSVMTNVSAYDYYPFVLPDNIQLRNGFFNEYDSRDITMYYMKHPVSFIRMMDVAVKSTTSLNRSSCGNFEKSYGMPPKAKSVFWSGWNYFKIRYAPKTVAYLFLLVIIAYLAQKKRVKGSSISLQAIENIKILELTLILLAIGLSQAAITIIMSGVAEFTQHGFLLGASTDMIVYFLVAKAISGFR